MRWVGHVALMADKKKRIEVCVGRAKVTRPLRIPRNKWMIILKLVLKIRLEGREVD